MAVAAVMFGASVVMGAVATRSKNKALAAEQRARTEAGQRKADELARQQVRADEVSQEQKSDLANEMDIQLGRIQAAAGEGGRSNFTAAREAGAIGSTFGADFARVESNRLEGHRARAATETSIIEENNAAIKATKKKQTSNIIGFFGSTLSSAASVKKWSSPSSTVPTSTIDTGPEA
jgi:hypothetical protein